MGTHPSQTKIFSDYYRFFQPDVRVLHTIQQFTALGIEKYSLVLDRGFFSQGNLEEFLEEKLSFVIPAPLSLKTIKELMIKSSSLWVRWTGNTAVPVIVNEMVSKRYFGL